MLTTSFSIGFGDKLAGLAVEVTVLGVFTDVFAAPLFGGEEEGESVAETEVLLFVPASALETAGVAVDVTSVNEVTFTHSSVFSFR